MHIIWVGHFNKDIHRYRRPLELKRPLLFDWICFLYFIFKKARGKKRQSGLFPGNHVKILDRKASGGGTSGPVSSPITESVSRIYLPDPNSSKPG